MGWFGDVMNTKSANDQFWDKQKIIDKQNSGKTIQNKINALEESMDIIGVSGKQRSENAERITYWKDRLKKI